MVEVPSGVSYSQSDDVVLVLAIASGRDEAAFAELFVRYAARLTAHFTRGGRQRSQAEDLAQDVLLSVWSHAASYRPEMASVSTWIFRIARNRFIDVVRKQKHIEIEPTEEMLPSDGDALDDLVGTQRLGVQLELAISELPDEQAEVLRGSYYQHETATELADRLQIPVGTVKSRLRAALIHMKRRIFDGGAS